MKTNDGGIIDHPMRHIADHELPRFLERLWEMLDDLVTKEELEESAKLAKRDHWLAIGQQLDGLTPAEKRSLEIQRSSAFWREPKDLQLTLAACCFASMAQGWAQVANGNLGWTNAFGIEVDPRDKSRRDGTWKFSAIQAMPW